MSQEIEHFYSRNRNYPNAQVPLTSIEQDFYTEQSRQNDKQNFNKHKENTRLERMRTYYYQTTIHALEKLIDLQHQIINRQDRFINSLCFVFGLNFVIILFFIVLFVLKFQCNFKN
ncbi:unnamed protein product [Rhizophagus irregularis]|uniref:Transmembrane protein n=1 Tax=Rhizophagus irregularis TaxID=588596 RepID=A0A2N1MCE3_9GLOM|nr:hypothetical protein RhiirC2_795028 [Rhizophagus irregularis]CAB4381557.1 unnamed protein product [Rhizophagus irregularis]CAB5392277.1 unnamed protein product [Rhizophagus irregularis]